MSVITGSFTKSTGAATASQAVTGLGFQPKLLMLWTQANTTESAIGSDMLFSHGFSDGTNDFCVGNSDENALATSNTNGVVHTDRILCILNKSGTKIAQCSVTSFDSDGFTLSWDVNDSNAYYIFYWAIGGADITGISVGNFAADTSGSNQSITGPGFQPDMIYLLTATKTTSDSIGAGACFSMGWAISTTLTMGMGSASEDNVTSLNESYERGSTSGICLIPQSAAAARHSIALLSSIDATGFTLDWSFGTPADAILIGYIAVKGPSFKLGRHSLNTATGSHAITGVGLQPESLLFHAPGMPFGTSTTTSHRVSWGMAAGSVDKTIGFDHHSFDKAVSFSDGDDTFYNYRQVDGVTTLLGDLTSFDADGFTINIDTNNIAATSHLYWLAYKAGTVAAGEASTAVVHGTFFAAGGVAVV